MRSHSKEMPDGKEMQAPLSDPRVHPAALTLYFLMGQGDELQDSMKCTWKRLASPCTAMSRVKAAPNNFLCSHRGSENGRLTLFSKNLLYNYRKEARERIQEDKRINTVKFSRTVLSILFSTDTHLHSSVHLVHLWTKFAIFSPISLVQIITSF